MGTCIDWAVINSIRMKYHRYMYFGILIDMYISDCVEDCKMAYFKLKISFTSLTFIKPYYKSVQYLDRGM